MSVIKANKHQIGNNIVLTSSGGDLIVNQGVHDNALTEIARFKSDGLQGSDVSYVPAGTGAVARTVQDKLREVVSVKDFGAVGDGVTDDTAAIQAAIDAAIAQNKWLDGLGGTYAAGGLVFASGFKLRNINLIHNKNADMVSVLQTADTILVENVYMDNVHVDGNRNTQTGVTGTTTREDGGRHALAIRGACKNIFIRNSSFNNSAADGLCLFPALATSAYNVQNVVLENCDFIGNRRHGISADTVDGLRLIRCRLNGNGLSTAEGYPDNDGHTGAKSSVGTFYGNGIDVEEYEASKGSRNIWFVDCEAKGNARGGFLILRTSNATASTEFGFYNFIGCDCDEGLFRDSGASIEITPNGRGATGLMFSNVRVENCNLNGGAFLIRNGSAYVVQVKSSHPYAVSALEFATVVTDSSSIYEAATGQILKTAITTRDYSFRADGIKRGWGIGTYVDSVTMPQRPGDAYFFNIVDGINRVRGSFAFEQTGEGPMRFTVRGGVGSPSNYFSATSWGFFPGIDNTTNLGTASYRWKEIFAVTPTINTSDEREKQDIAALDDAEKRVAVALKGLVKKFRFKDAAAEKGDDARIHVGVIAQEVMTAFQAEGLDATRYGLLCYDQWDAELDKDGNEVRPAGDRYGIRYEELLAFIIAAL